MNRSTKIAAAAIVACVHLVACGGSSGTDPGGGSPSRRPAAMVIVSGDSQTATVGTELPGPLVVRVIDASGNPVVGQVVNFRVTSGGGSVFAGASATNAQGQAQERWTLGDQAGPQTMEARAVDNTTGAALVFATFTATATASAPAAIVVASGDAQTADPGTALPRPLVVRLTDQHGNGVAGAVVDFTPLTGGGTADPARTSTDTSGRASTVWTLGPASGQQTLQASSSGLAPAVFAATAAPTPVDVAVYWEFARNTWIDGVAGTVPYDSNVNWPPGTGDRACPQAGVDFVTVTDVDGNVLANDVPCVNSSVQGVLLTSIPGAATYVVTGWRTGIDVPLYGGQATVSVAEGTPTFTTVVAHGIPSALTVSATLGGVNYPTCGNAGVDRLDGWIVDGLGTLVWRDWVACGPQDVPGISFGPVDRDVDFLWMQASGPGGGTPSLLYSRCNYEVPHFTSGENWFTLDLPSGLCAPSPP